MVTGFGRRARATAISAVAVAALALTACTGPDQTHDDDDINTVNAALATGIDEAVAAAMQYSGAESAIVGVWSASGDYVRGYGDGVTAASQFRGAQATQPVMCALLLDLAADDVIPLDREISEDLPRQVGIEGITYRQLCTATSGLADFKTGLRDIFVNNPTRPWSDRELLTQGIARSPLPWPGLDVYPSDTNTLLLARAISVATGTSVTDLLQQRVFSPAGMGSSFYPREMMSQTTLPSGGMNGATYPSSQGVPVCDAGPVAVTNVSPSMLSGAGATVTTVTDLKSFYESYLSGSFGEGSAALVTDTVSTVNPARDAEGNPTEEPNTDPNQRRWGFGLEQYASLYGMSGSITGTNTAAYHDPTTGFTVVVTLANSSVSAEFVRRLGLQIAALAAEAGSGPEVTWTAADQGAALAAAAICQPPAEEAAEGEGEG